MKKYIQNPTDNKLKIKENNPPKEVEYVLSFLYLKEKGTAKISIHLKKFLTNFFIFNKLYLNNYYSIYL